MRSPDAIEIELQADDAMSKTSGTARVRPLRPSERAKNSLRKLGTFWGIGLACVLLPLIHFILVPLFLVLGIYFAALTAAVDRFIVSGSVSCPACRKAFFLKPAPEHWPMEELCENCQRRFEVRPAALTA